MSATLEQQRYRVGSHSLHIVQQGDLGWSAWLNVEDIDFSGLCLATGATRSDAQGAAIRVLHMLAGVLERPPVREFQLDGTTRTGRLGSEKSEELIDKIMSIFLLIAIAFALMLILTVITGFTLAVIGGCK